MATPRMERKYVIMGAADDSYDFGEIPRFVEKLRTGYDLVQGCRISGSPSVSALSIMPTPCGS
jgi:hypothetical protein